MPRSGPTVASQDRALLIQVATVMLDHMDSALAALRRMHRVHSAEIVHGLNGHETAMLRVEMKHPRGERIHLYTIRISETTT
jgi:hypothetical protein